MIKIIIVNNDKQCIHKILKIVSKVSVKYDKEISTKSYYKYNKDLKNEISNCESKKIYILGIDLKDDVSGIEIGEKIRVDDWDSEIIYVTSHADMFESVFRSVVDVFDFIEKFHNLEKRLAFDIERIFNKNFDKNMFVYSTRNMNIKIFYRSILYIYRDTVKRKIVVVTESNTYHINSCMNDIFKLLDIRFKFVHRACIINVQRVSKLDWNNGSFYLENGNCVNLLSKKYKKEIEEVIS